MLGLVRALSRSNGPNFLALSTCEASTAAATSASPSRQSSEWDICAALYVARSPIVAPPMSKVERYYADQVLKEMNTRSLKNNWELKAEKDERLLRKRAELEAAGKDLSSLDGELGVTNKERELNWRKQAEILEQSLSERVKSGRVDAIDSLQRKLDRRLILLVQQRFGRPEGYQSPWILPQTVHQDGESLHEAALRCWRSISPASHSTSFHLDGTAPYAVHTHKYARPVSEQRNGKVGAKIFFFAGFLSPPSSAAASSSSTQQFRPDSSAVGAFQWTTYEEACTLLKGRHRYATRALSAHIE